MSSDSSQARISAGVTKTGLASSIAAMAARRDGRPARISIDIMNCGTPVSTAAAARPPDPFPVPDAHAVDPLEFVSNRVRFVEQPTSFHLHAFRQQRVDGGHINRSAVVVLRALVVVLRVRRCIIIARRPVRGVVDDALVGLCKQVEEEVVSRTFAELIWCDACGAREEEPAAPREGQQLQAALHRRRWRPPVVLFSYCDAAAQRPLYATGAKADFVVLAIWQQLQLAPLFR